MKFRMLLASAALLLAGCASTNTKDGLVRRDGSWYSPAREGHGDYYTGSERRYLEASPWAWSVGFTPYDGYCSAIYRYCTSYWSSPWYGIGASPWAWAWVPPTTHRRPYRGRDLHPISGDDVAGAPPSSEPTPIRTGGNHPRRPEGGWAGSRREPRGARVRRGRNGSPD